MIRTMFAAASALLLAGCATYGGPGAGYPAGQPYPDDGYGHPPGYPPPQGYPPAQEACPITRSGEWNAWVNMMPGPNARPTLHVTGKVVVPTGGYQIGFDPQLQIRESYPAQAFATLRATPPNGPATQAVMTHEVSWEWPLSQQVGSLEIHCGDRTLATFSPLQTAH